jgi:creatinine amidohydrolase
MGMRNLTLALALSFCAPFAHAQAQKPPDTVLLEELTWEEVRDLIKGGKNSIIIATAGTEQKGPHMVIGEHKFILQYTTDKIARALGNALVAPIITYVPEGDWNNPTRGHMSKAGTITLPNDRFMVLLEHTAKSLKAGGFTDIIYIGDSGGNQNGMRDVAAKLNEEWKGSGARAHFIGDYYTKASADARAYLTGKGFAAADIGNHAGMLDTSEMMFVNAKHVRMNKRAPNGGMPDSGVSGDPTKATPEIGKAILDIKINNAVNQIRASLAKPKGDQL